MLASARQLTTRPTTKAAAHSSRSRAPLTATKLSLHGPPMGCTPVAEAWHLQFWLRASLTAQAFGQGMGLSLSEHNGFTD